jgi:hypothetical protein
MEKYTVLRTLPDLPTEKRVSVSGTISDEADFSESRLRTVDERRVSQVGVLAMSDPEAASEIAMQVRDISLRAVALCIVAPVYSKINQAEAENWLGQATEKLEDLPPDITKLKLLGALAVARLMEGKRNLATELLNKSFDLGEELFYQYMRSNPGAMAYSTPATATLANLSERFSEAPKTRNVVIFRVRSLRDDRLRAKLLVAAARGLHTTAVK